MVERFYPIVDSAAWLERLVPLGIGFVQLRLKDTPADQARAEIARGLAICRAHGATLVVNDFWRAAIELGADWVHLGQADLAGADLAAIRTAGLKLGVSTHDDGELATALAAEPDYVALGPVFPTTLKEMAFAPQGLDRVADWKRRVAPLPLVAIGGITAERARDVYAAGADSIAAVTDVIKRDHPEERVRAWLAAARDSQGAPP